MSEPSPSKLELCATASGLIDLCVRVAQFIGLPKSVGEIYGLLFVSPQPLCLDQCIETLGISQGSASQGLRELRQLRAIKPVYVPGDRRDFYLPETGLGTLAQGFLSHRVLPAIEDLTIRVEVLRRQFKNDGSESNAFLATRLKKSLSWIQQTRQALTTVELLLPKTKPKNSTR